MIELKLKASDFKSAKFSDIKEGPICRSLKRKFPDADIIGGVYSTYCDGIVYWHEPYTIEEFDSDKQKASEFWYLPIFGIRRIKLDEHDKGRMDQYFQSAGDAD